MPATRPPMAMALKTALSVKRTERLSFGIESYRKESHTLRLRQQTPFPRLSALGDSPALRRMYAPHGLHVIRVRSALIFPISFDPGKAQRETSGIAGTLLQVTEGDFHYQLGPH